MVRLLFFGLITLAAFSVARGLWPALRTRGGALTYWGLSAVALSGWLIPALLGHGVLGTVPVLGEPLKLFSAAWMVATFVTVILGSSFLVMHQIVGGVEKLRRKTPPETVDQSRRGFLTGIGRTVPVAAVATSIGGVANGNVPFTVRRHEVQLKGLPDALDGFRIGQITDIHVGAFIDAAYVRNAVEAMNAEKVDLQVMTGDLIDDLSQSEATFAALEQCRAPHGLLAILGNHEHWRGLPEIVARYSDIQKRGGPVKLLVDESVVLEHRGTKLHVVGVDYPISERGEGRDAVMVAQAQRAFSTTDPNDAIICLAHHPDFFPHAAERGARLTLSGHTHGGQVAFLGIPAFRFAFKYMLGWYRWAEHKLYVSGGTGHWLPFRVGVPAEVTIFTLRAV